MMRKKYLRPETAQTVVACDRALLAGSLSFDDEDGTGTGSLENGDADGEALTRRSSIWNGD